MRFGRYSAFKATDGVASTETSKAAPGECPVFQWFDNKIVYSFPDLKEGVRRDKAAEEVT